MDQTVLAIIILAALVGLNYLARDPRAEGRAWRVSNTLTRFGVPMAVIGLVFLWVVVELGNHFNFWNLEPSARAPFDLAMAIGTFLYFGGHLAILVSLLTRAWLRFDAYLRKVGPANFAKNVARMGWTVGKGGLKLYVMALAALVAVHLVGLRNLLFLGLLKGTLNSGPAPGDRNEPRRDGDGRRAGATPAS